MCSSDLSKVSAWNSNAVKKCPKRLVKIRLAGLQDAGPACRRSARTASATGKSTGGRATAGASQPAVGRSGRTATDARPQPVEGFIISLMRFSSHVGKLHRSDLNFPVTSSVEPEMIRELLRNIREIRCAAGPPVRCASFGPHGLSTKSASSRAAGSVSGANSDCHPGQRAGSGRPSPVRPYCHDYQPMDNSMGVEDAAGRAGPGSMSRGEVSVTESANCVLKMEALQQSVPLPDSAPAWAGTPGEG